MSIDELKERIFSYGIFGVHCATLPDDDLLILLNEAWVEFVTQEQIKELESSFTTIALESKQKELFNLFENKKNELLNSKNTNSEMTESNYDQLTVHLNFDYNQENMRYNGYNGTFDKLSFPISCLLRNITDQYIVRMNTVAWKEYITNGSFNFTSKEYYFVFDMLIRVNDFISVSDMRTTLNVEPKKMFYIIKKLTLLGYVDRIEQENKIFVRIKRDSNGKVLKGKIKQKKRSINSEDNPDLEEKRSSTEKIIGTDLLIGVPLIMQIKKFIEKSRTGVSSKDIQEKFGIKLKIGLKLLNKIADKMDGSIKTVEEFEGKIKRTKFYNVNELSKRKERKRLKIQAGEQSLYEEGVTLEDRIEVIKEFLSKKKAFLLDKDTFQEFQNILGCKYTLDRRTIINAATKGGFNVYKLAQTSTGAKIIITRKDVHEDDPAVKIFEHQKKQFRKLTTVFQSNVYKFFVLSNKFTEIDNLFIPCLRKRISIFRNFLESIQEDTFNFNFDIINKMSIYNFFQLISFKRFHFLEDLIEMLKSSEIEKENNRMDYTHFLQNDTLTSPMNHTNLTLQDITRDEISFGDRMHNGVCQNHNSHQQNKINVSHLEILGISTDLDTLRILQYPMKKILEFDLPTEMVKLLRIKFELKPFIVYLRELEKDKVIELKIDSTEILVKKTKNNFFKLITYASDLFDNYLNIVEREAFFEKIINIRESRFHKECLFIINRDYDENKRKTLLLRLSAFKKQFPISIKSEELKKDFLPSLLENDYMKVKKDLIFYDKIDFEMYKYDDLEIILKFMRNRKIISYCNETYENIQLSSHFIKKMSIKYDHIICTDVKDRNQDNQMYQYQLKYFDMIYYNLMKTASCEINKLSDMVNILESFELLSFFDYFTDYFSVENKNGKYYVSIRENSNLYLQFFEN